MSTTISKIAQNNNLNSNQIDRVCQMANRITFLNIFDGGRQRIIEFPVADSKMISSPVEKTASIDVSDDKYFPGSEIINIAPLEKTAEAEESHDDKKLQRMWYQLKHAKEYFEDDCGGKEHFFKKACDSFVEEGVQLLKGDNTTFEDIIQACNQASENKEVIQFAAKELSKKAANLGILKMAGKVPSFKPINTDHPFVVKFKNLEKTAQNYIDARAALYLAGKYFDQVNKEVKWI